MGEITYVGSIYVSAYRKIDKKFDSALKKLDQEIDRYSFDKTKREKLLEAEDKKNDFIFNYLRKKSRWTWTPTLEIIKCWKKKSK